MALHPDVSQASADPGRTWYGLWRRTVASEPVDSRAAAGDPQRSSHAGRCPDTWAGRPGQGRCAAPFLHDGTKRPLPHPHDPDEQTRCSSGKKTRHTGKNVLPIKAGWLILFLRELYAGSIHD
jgi:hypothetical protein